MTMTHKEAIDRVMGDSPWDHDYDAAKKQIRAYIESRGLVLVPKEPTGKMRAAQALAEASYATDSDAGRIYRAMLAAAPDPFKEGE